jgi:hypothetical protein
VKLVQPQLSWVHVLACFQIRACTTFGRLAQCSRSPRTLALLPLAAGHGHAIAAGRLTRRSGLHSALASRWPSPRRAHALLAAGPCTGLCHGRGCHDEAIVAHAPPLDSSYCVASLDVWPLSPPGRLLDHSSDRTPPCLACPHKWTLVSPTRTWACRVMRVPPRPPLSRRLCMRSCCHCQAEPPRFNAPYSLSSSAHFSPMTWPRPRHHARLSNSLSHGSSAHLLTSIGSIGSEIDACTSPSSR